MLLNKLLTTHEYVTIIADRKDWKGIKMKLIII